MTGNGQRRLKINDSRVYKILDSERHRSVARRYLKLENDLKYAQLSRRFQNDMFLNQNTSKITWAP